MNVNVQDKTKSLILAVGLSGFLALIKGLAGFYCRSSALMASALDSFLDMGVSSMNYWSIKRGSKPPDSDHAYGHEKIESLASYTQGVLFLGLAIFILWETVQKIFYPRGIEHSALALVTIAVACLVNTVITAALHSSEKKTGSLILKTEKTHYSMDILSYLMIFAVLLLERWTHWIFWDAIGGILVVIYVSYLAVQILLQSGNELVDKALARPYLDELDRIIMEHDPRVAGYHELRTRKVGDKFFIDFHLVLLAKSLESAHNISESLIHKIKSRFGNADVTIHEDPEGENS
jgi:ferrous-iron efflux pump FieF